MLTKEKNGIICDICKSKHSELFTYYSLRCSKSTITNNYKNDNNTSLCIDVCEKCADKFKDLIIKNYTPTKCHNNHLPNGIYCDLNNSHYMIDNYELYKIICDEVSIIRIIENKKDENTITLIPELKISENLLEFNCCTQCFKEHINDIR